MYGNNQEYFILTDILVFLQFLVLVALHNA